MTEPNVATIENTALSTSEELEALNLAVSKLAGQVAHVFVTGAGGFLGQALCKLLRSADIKVTGFARGDYPELSQLGVTMIKGDISDFDGIKAAMNTCDLVFHVAAKAGVWGSEADYVKANVDGTINVINACRELAISKLVYTSTPSVTFAGVDETGNDEAQPYADKFLNYYAKTKAQAEQLVLAAAHKRSEKSNLLKTVALRPHLIWGPKDPHLVPRVLARAKAGKLKLVGQQDKLVDTIYIDNAAYAHILAAIALSDNDSRCNGKAYYISNDEPITMAAMLNKILNSANLPAVNKRVPSAVAYFVGATLECLYKLLNKKQEPIMTRFVARQLSTSHYFNISAAKKDFAYHPLVTIDQGMKRLKRSLSK